MTNSFEQKLPENIFLDFMNPELREAWGVNTNNKQNFILFRILINLSVFLTKEYCILPPAFVFEDPMSFKLVKKTSDYVKSGYIYIPLKFGESFPSKLNKILNEYRDVKSNYINLTNQKKLDKIVKYFSSLESAKILKETDTGKLIALGFRKKFESHNIYWRNILNKYDSKSIDELLKIPTFLIENKLAITHGDIFRRIRQRNINSVDIHKLVHYEYGEVYMNEYECVPFHNLFTRFTFSPTHRTNNKGYDFQIIKIFFESLNIFWLLGSLNPSMLINLRRRCSEYSEFIKNYFFISNACQSKDNIEKYLAKIISSDENLKNIVSPIIQTLSIDYLANVLEAFNFAVRNNEPANIITEENINNMNNQKINKIAIFVALKEEEEILVEALKLTIDIEKNCYKGKIKNTSVEVFSPRKLGRVSAALETFSFLDKTNLPDMVLVVGIAGGFSSNKIEKGDILIPSVIYDISNTKKEGGDESYEIFRPDPFRVNQKMIHYINGPKFSKDRWLIEAKKLSRRPDLNIKISTQPMCCCDSVIKDEDWISTVLEKVTSTLTGVEMESGGVCMALEKFHKAVPISIIRGVSDLSNPYKADDQWRGIAMWTVCSLILEINFSDL